MATKARQQYFADEVSLSKEKREFSIADEIQQKIDSIEPGAQVNKIETVKVNGTALVPDANKAVNIDVPEVIDNLYTVDSDNALSAKQGKLLYDYIQNIASRGRFLSNWNSATGLPMTNPSENPYPYKSGDYFIVSNVAGLGGTNYRPDGSSYTIGQASTVVETDSVDVSDFYFYDGTNWLLLKNSGRSLAVDSSLSTTSTNPVENRVITNALNGKQETLIAGNNIQIAADGKTISATDTTYSAGANISIDANNEISATDTTYTAGANVQISNQNVISATDTKYTAGTGINIDANNVISNTQTSAEWGNITGTLSDQTDLQTALNAKQDDMVILKYGISTWNDFITAYNKNGVVYCRASSNSNPASGSQTRLAFMAYVNNETTPTEVEFQYYRSRSSHSTAANVLDEVYVYKLVSTNGGTWTVTQRDTAAKPLAGTGIGLTFNSSGMTISADTSVLATQTDLNSKQDTLVSGTNIKTINSNSLLGSGDIALNDVKVSATAPSSPTEGMVWYDTTNDVVKVYDGTNWNVVGDDAANINTKTFLLASDSDKATATEAYKWFSEGNYPIIMRGSATFVGPRLSGDNLVFTQTEPYYSTGATTTLVQPRTITFMYDTSTEQVTQILYSIGGGISVLETNKNYSTPYTPQYDGSPATKKYVDDSVIEYNAGEGIGVGTYNDYSAMQGPAPDGFHIPMQSEWSGLKSIMNGMSLTSSDNRETYLHMPLAGTRSSSHAVIENQGSYAYYWSCSPNSNNSYYLAFDYVGVYIDTYTNRAEAYPIRSFKDYYATPDSSWTVVQGTLGGAGIFWNQTKGLISITNGTNGYTIMDKNLGATTVYNYGDTLSEANCGKYYQWGNNYGFAWAGTIADQSTTQVNASSYGPGNYYNSSTFIILSDDWSNVQNDDLWGGVTGVVAIDNVITNTGVLSVNGQTGAVTVNEGEVRVFAVPSVNDDISDMITRLSAGKGVILHEMVSGTDAFYKVDYHDDVTQEITASLLYSYNGGYARFYTIVYNYSTKKVSTKTSSLTYFFAPETAGTQGQVLTKTNSGYEWAAPQGTTYNAGEGIEIGTIQDYSAMQGPAPDGFHVPLNTEWQAVYDIWTALGGGSSDGTNFGIALKLPFAGYRFASSAGVGAQGSYGLYWSSSRNNTNNAYLLNFNSSDVLPQNANYRAFGYSVRCFKNSPTVPTSSWTKLYGTSIEAGGIFWSSTEGLISMSSDGQTWITIQDKNLGATTVWNSGDTLSEANCGKHYQRGNNYGFPRTGSVTTSSTQVDASTYGPGNYYSSSTFITRNSSPYRWDTTDNGNLRGGVTGVITRDNAITNTGVLSVNGQTGNVTIEAFQLAPNSPLTPRYRRYGSQAQYDALTQYYTDEPGDTVYFTI